MSFFAWRGYGQPRFVGLYNYQWILTKDRLFRKALQVTGSYALLAVPLGLILAFVIAWMLNKRLFGVVGMRSLYYVPSVVTGVAVAFMWMYILDPRNGPLNIFLQSVLRLKEPIPWLASPRWILPSFTLMSLWGIGSSMIILLAGLKGIPTTLYEAAIIDGANGWQRLWKITIPLLSPSLFYVLIILTIRAFQVITVPLVIFEPESGRSQGPMNSALFYTLYLYRKAFVDARMGYACALGWILFIIIMVLTITHFVVVGHKVYYEE
jgi:multiple sugar transport system permease protein